MRGQHGGMGFHSGVRGIVLDANVQGHHPKHFPYAFRWAHGLAPALQQALPPAAAERSAQPASAGDVATQLTKQDARLAAEAMTQPANAPTSRMAAAEQVAIKPEQKPTGQ